jgi:D-ornithine 4,5-aminomutase subunit alpha
MGFSSMEAKAIVEKTIDRELIGKGAGHVVYRVAKEKGLAVREAGLELADGRLWDLAEQVFDKKPGKGFENGEAGDGTE